MRNIKYQYIFKNYKKKHMLEEEWKKKKKKIEWNEIPWNISTVIEYLNIKNF